MAKFYSINQSTRSTKARNRETNVQEYTKEQQLKGHAKQPQNKEKYTKLLSTHNSTKLITTGNKNSPHSKDNAKNQQDSSRNKQPLKNQTYDFRKRHSPGSQTNS
jgi:hypothetical protein